MYSFVLDAWKESVCEKCEIREILGMGVISEKRAS